MSRDTALLVIDMQQGLYDEGVYQGEALLEKINGLVDEAHTADVPVIYVQHNAGDTRDSLHPSLPGWALHPAIVPTADEIIVQKTHANSFEDTPLKSELDKLGVHKLVITGMQSDECVRATSKGAAQLGYDVTVVADAHSTWDGHKPSARHVIDGINDELRAASVHLKDADQITFE